jgi:hypothetical protein
MDRKSFDFFSDLLAKPQKGKGFDCLMATKAPWDAKAK